MQGLLRESLLLNSNVKKALVYVMFLQIIIPMC